MFHAGHVDFQLGNVPLNSLVFNRMPGRPLLKGRAAADTKEFPVLCLEKIWTKTFVDAPGAVNLG